MLTLLKQVSFNFTEHVITALHETFRLYIRENSLSVLKDLTPCLESKN